jgi:hypothetical protein
MNRTATKNKLGLTLSILLLAAMCLCYLFPISFFEPNWDYRSEGYIEGDTYRINSKTILEAINNGNTYNLFVLQTETDGWEDDKDYSLVRWSQEEFLRVFNTFKQTILHTANFEQSVDLMNFEISDCKNMEYGPQSAYISTYTFLSGIFDWPPFRAASYSYSIDLPYNKLRWKGTIFNQYVLEKYSILDLKTIKIPAEEALRIAEINGGKEARLAIENQCSIEININANLNNGNWIVTYYSNDHTVRLFSIEINKVNAEHNIRVNGAAGAHGFASQ